MADTYKTIQCPACGRQMKKIFIPSAGISVDICAEGCGGIFFDNQEIKKFNEPSSDISLIKKELEGKTFIEVDESKIRVCPACNKSMVKTTIKGAFIQIDTCYNCGGTFLDNGELEAIRRRIGNKPSEQIKSLHIKSQNGVIDNNTIRQIYQEAQREKLIQNRSATIAKSLLGQGRRGFFGSRSSYGLVDFIFDLLQ